MILVDTSIWISHLRKTNSHLKCLLMDEQVVCHPLIIGELACGNLKNRKEITSLLKTLPQGKTAENDEILDFIENKKLFGSGVGIVDVQLLASAMLTKILLWTSDKPLRVAALKFSVLYK